MSSKPSSVFCTFLVLLVLSVNAAPNQESDITSAITVSDNVPKGRTVKADTKSSSFDLSKVGPQLAAALTNEAQRLNAPLSEKSLQRVNADYFVGRKSTRFTNIIIYNTSNKPFKMTEHKCGSGRYSAPLLPEWDIRPYTSTVYGVESFGFMTGCTNCEVKYEAPDGQSWFKVYTSNPYWGYNHAGVRDSDGVSIQTVCSGGNKNIVAFRLN